MGLYMNLRLGTPPCISKYIFPMAIITKKKHGVVEQRSTTDLRSLQTSEMIRLGFTVDLPNC